MVNNKSGRRFQVLSLLRDTSAPVTGEELGRRLGISRVAIHKHIRALKDSGYPVESGRRGYMLGMENAALLTSWEFGPEENIRVFRSVSSTMDEASRLADRLTDDFTVVAERQEAGRGRRRRSWESPEGGLWTTRVVHPQGSAMFMQRHVLAAAAAMARLLRESWDLNARVKWPNDVYVGRRKVAGLLGEAGVTGDRILHLAVGMGLNVNNASIEGAGALKEFTGRSLDRRSILRDWTQAFDGLLREDADMSFPRWYTPLLARRGETVRYELQDGGVSGRIIGVDGLGRLHIEQTGGGERFIAPGDIQ